MMNVGRLGCPEAIENRRAEARKIMNFGSGSWIVQIDWREKNFHYHAASGGTPESEFRLHADLQPSKTGPLERRRGNNCVPAYPFSKRLTFVSAGLNFRGKD